MASPVGLQIQLASAKSKSNGISSGIASCVWHSQDPIQRRRHWHPRTRVNSSISTREFIHKKNEPNLKFHATNLAKWFASTDAPRIGPASQAPPLITGRRVRGERPGVAGPQEPLGARISLSAMPRLLTGRPPLLPVRFGFATVPRVAKRFCT